MEGCKKYVHLGRGRSNRRFLNLGITKISKVYLSKAWFVALNIVKLTIRILLLWHSAHQKCRVTLHKEEREALAEPTDSHFLSFTNLPGLSCCIEYGMAAPSKGTLTGHGKTRLGKYDFRPRLAETKRKNKFSRHLAGKICMGSSQFWLDKFGQISTKIFKMICNRGSYFISKLSNLVQKSTAPAASSHSLTAMPAAHQQIKTNTNKKTKRQTQRQIQRDTHTQIRKNTKYTITKRSECKKSRRLE